MPEGADTERILGILEDLKQHLASGSPNISEADTKANFIDPMVSALGYNGLAEVQREFYVTETKDRLDYVLKVDGQKRMAIEAKSLGHDLTDADAGQLVQYCSVVGIEWAVVTNARQWWLYHQFAQVPLQEKLVFTLDLVAWNTPAEFQALMALLTLVSKTAFLHSDGPGAWQRAQRLDELLRDALTSPKTPEVAYLQSRVKDQGLAVTVEDVAAWAKAKLLGQTSAPAPVLYPPIGTEAPIGSSKLGEPRYWMVPASSKAGETAVQSLHHWLDKGMWGFYESTPSRSALDVGDRVAFYATGVGVVGHALVAAKAMTLLPANEWPEPHAQTKQVYKLALAEVTWLKQPLAITAVVRGSLEAFKGKNPSSNWAWLVQTTRRLTRDDFQRLIGRD